MQVLRAHRRRHLDHRTQAIEGRKPWTDTGYVFVRTNGMPINPNYATTRVRKLVQRAGLPPVRLHDLRHGAVSLAHEAGADLMTMQDLLRHAWKGNGAVRLLDYYEESGTRLLERLDATRTPSTMDGVRTATRVLAELLARLTSAPAPEGLRQLSDITAAMLDQAPHAVPALRDPAEQQLVRTCASAVPELIGEPGDRLLHWDLHHDNVLAGEREPWQATDPEPLAGDPGFDLWPALDGRWDSVVATGDVTRAVLRRFDQLTEVLGLDRRRAAGWTLGRVLLNALWDIEDGRATLEPAQVAVATALLGRPR